LDIAAFEREPAGGFRSLAPMPAWFMRVSRDGTLPFLGHILEEAHVFWDAAAEGVREWGPCADVDEAGKEFHYRVKALRVGASAYMVLQIDDGADRLRELLQKVRNDALIAARNPPQR
jgi:hypothetical protein